MAPPKKDTVALTLRLPVELLEGIDEVRRAEADIPTRPEMIRRILSEWFETRSGDKA
ncbi:Ribbon-helix-helix protein, copG family [Rhodovulum sp. ES.010]|uniref:ribbon-helix-helix protein, CopG family n=1 Tax=Rhodovulum sp. ES.010 TaxID=1882821 RepID=UPI00092BEEAE|nr:ribbon-helix-helix protein, CopG family [Rhodovulum sp. ES.010]SIN99313.1 Ribbon-helix-helix protein, copG family [Rhodovulum sp. ES.010]